MHGAKSDMAVRRLIVSDLHFGSGDELLTSAAALERIEPELAWADELVVNGDLLELVFASLEDAVAAARPFLALAARHVGRVHYVPGNHDHHLVSLAGDERRFARVLGAPPAQLFGVAPAQRLLRALCPDVDVVTAYPLCALDGLQITHGHYVAPHLGSSDWRLMDSLAWRLTGAATRPERLTVCDYEGLITPLYELMYEIASLPSGQRAQQRFERWLSRPSRLLARHGPSTTQVVAAMQTVCSDLELPPGSVVFGHTHVPLDGVATTDGRHRLFNSGSWVWDHRTRVRAQARRKWPGTVLRATGGELELRALLADCDERDLARMVAKRPQRSAARSGRRGSRLAAACRATTGTR